MENSLFQIQRTCEECSFLCVQFFLKGKHVPIEYLEKDKLKLSIVLDKAALKELNAQLEPLHLKLVEAKPSFNIENIKASLEIWLYQPEVSIEYTCAKYLCKSFKRTYKVIRDFFEKETETTISEYCIWHKIDRAKKMLEDPQKSIQEIAKELNYNTIGLFNRQFKRKTGVTPKAFRASFLAQK